MRLPLVLAPGWYSKAMQYHLSIQAQMQMQYTAPCFTEVLIWGFGGCGGVEGNRKKGQGYEHVYSVSGLELLVCESSWGVRLESSWCIQIKITLVRIKQASLHEAVHLYISQLQ